MDKTKKRVSLSAKMNLLIVSIILTVSVGLVLISSHFYSRKVTEYYFTQAELAAQAARDQILPDFAENLWNGVNTDEFRRVREEAVAAGDESLIMTWMRSRPSGVFPNDDNDGNAHEELPDPEKEKEYDDLYGDYEVLISVLKECVRLFDITSAYIQHDENRVTYNLADPDEPLFKIGMVEDQIDVFADYANNEYFPPMIYRSDFGWLCTTLLPLAQTADGTIPGYVGIDIDMNRVVRQQRMFLVNSGIYILALTAAAILISMFLVNRVAVDPLRQLSQAAAGFAKDDAELKKEDVIRLPIRSNDEIGDLYHQIRSMQARIIDYTEHLTQITAERERVSTELHMAEKIQTSMIPGTFPAFPDRAEFDLYASMTPAREVGGDFYDFFMPDDSHLAVLIADVSDKGVPAALFMMSSKILINYRARQGGTPAEILMDVNAQICRDNKSKMFVTVWMGILDLSSGVMTCTNAGHEYPFIRGADGSFHMFRDKHGLVIGAFSGAKYTDYELKLEPGDAVFVYTDGVPEANDSNGEFFGMDRLKTALNRAAGEAPQGILEQVEADVKAYVSGTDQFDDLTILCVEFRQPFVPPAEEQKAV